MNKIKVVMVFLIMSLIFTSCSQGKPTADENGGTSESGDLLPEAETTAEQVTTTEVKDSLPDDLDFGGETLTALVWAGAVSDWVQEEETGDILRDEVYTRNTFIEERLKIKINYISEGWNFDAVRKKLVADIAAGDTSYDIISGWAAVHAQIIPDGLLMNLHDVPYLNLTEQWWNQGVNSELAIDGKLHVAGGDANMSFIGNTGVFLLNKSMMQNYGLPDLYETVIDGKWTLDNMREMLKIIPADLNSDGVMNELDQYGLLISRWSGEENFADAVEAHMIKTGDDGNPILDADYEKFTVLIEKLYDIIYTSSEAYFPPKDDIDVTGMFRNNQSVLYTSTLGGSFGFRDWESDFGIIPYPKFSEEQENYRGSISSYASVFSVPVNCAKTEIAGAFMEAAASYGYNRITPQYFDIALKVKISRDEQTEKMIDIIRSGAYASFDQLYRDIVDMGGSVIGSMVREKRSNFASWYASNEIRLSKVLDRLVAKVEENG
jgi:hypothetical protein